MPSALVFLILAMSTWRLSHMLAVEDGPWNVFGEVRSHLGVRPGPVGQPPSCSGRNDPLSVLGCLVACPLCLSVWIAPIVLLLGALVPWMIWPLAALALSGISSLLELAVARRS